MTTQSGGGRGNPKREGPHVHTEEEEAAERLLDEAEDALDDGNAERALQLCHEVLLAHPRHAGALFVAADAERQLGDVARAEQNYRSVTQIDPEYSPAWSGLAGALFDQLRFDDARVAALRAIRSDPHNPEAAAVRGMLRERRGDHRGAARDFLRAARLDPDGFPPPEPLSDAMITAVVEEAKRDLHPSVRNYLDQVAFVVEEVPSEALCREFDPPALPGELLGVFSGAALSDRAADDPWTQLPSTIVLFRRNLERLAHDREHLIDELRVTVLHEVGHFLGLDEDDLEARGLD
jgi:predicted Zn-dependent protease with MMP-like domain/Tfp pilus assembly protein PilF